jgi:hypothetical protein
LARRVLCGATALIFVAGDLAAASGRLAGPPGPAPIPGWEREPPADLLRPPLLLANPEVQPANPCAVRQEKKKQPDPGVPPSVGRDKVDRLLRDRLRPDEPMVPPEPGMQPTPMPRAPVDEDAIRRLGEQLRRQPLAPVAGVVPSPDPG